jgi:hypothetical protein
MSRVLYKFLLFQLYLLLQVQVQVLFAQAPSKKDSDNEFTGTIGIMFGSSSINADAFSEWMRENTREGLSTSGFYHYGLEGFSVKNHVVYGLAWRHEGLFTTYSQVAPRRGSIAFHIGACPTNPSSSLQLLITVGIGYSAMTVKFHGSPPDVLSAYNIPSSKAIMIQNAFWVNPKVNLLHLIKFRRDQQTNKSRKVRVGLDAGVAFYLPGNFKYGYYYTYNTYGYNSKGQYVKQTHRKFFGHPVYDVPVWMPVSFNISGYIGF